MIFDKTTKTEEVQWMAISDMMTVLMMIFLFVAIAYMLDAKMEQKKTKDIVVTYSEMQNELVKSLNNEFEKDLEKWQAILDTQAISVRFDAPEVLFEQGSSEIRYKFKKILDDFFPRFVKILTNKDFINSIEEVRIEGHTSKEWYINEKYNENEAYILNMKLSQDRTRTILNYVLNLKSIEEKKWLRTNVTANGLSSSKLIIENGKENRSKSRRVEFRIKTKAEEKIQQILSN